MGTDHAKTHDGFASTNDPASQQAETAEEARKIRRLQLVMSMVMSVIGQDSSLTLEEASELAAGAKRAALAMFPDKELAYDLLYKPRLQRLIRDRFRLQ
jgi:methylaspartate ammonia-lyase